MAIHARTVLVLGAGASLPYGFPLGTDLIDRIFHHPTEYIIRHPGYADDGLPSKLHRSFQDKDIANFRNELRDSGLRSIDAFLSVRTEFSEIGRASIAAALIPCESQEKVNQKHKGDWCRYLRNLMGVNLDDFVCSAQNLRVINFNYDRSFEYLFFTYIKGSYGGSRALDIFRALKIVHPYGQLGQPDFLGTDGRAFSNELTEPAINKCVSELKVIGENVDKSREFRVAHDLLLGAQSLCFLGFGYLPQNVERLQLDRYFSGSRILGTAFNLGVRERKEAEALFNKPIILGTPQEDALEVMKNYDIFGPTE